MAYWVSLFQQHLEDLAAFLLNPKIFVFVGLWLFLWVFGLFKRMMHIL